MPKDLKALALVEACPYGPEQGARIRARKTLEALSELSDLTVVLVSRYSHPRADIERTSKELKLAESFTLAARPFSAVERIRHETDPLFLNTHQAMLSVTQQRRIRELASQNDLIWFHTIVPANGANIRSARPAVLDIDDLLSGYFDSQIKAQSVVRRLMDRRMAAIWKRRELAYYRRFPSLAVCSERDKQLLGNGSNVTVIPNGFDPSPPRDPLADRDPEPTIGFVGNLKYPPNREGLRWFIDSVWDRVRAAVPNCRLRISGAQSEQFASEQYPGIESTGWIEDLGAEMRRWWLTIVPIHSGSGTRIKIATAFSMRCPVVSTHLGAYGYNAKHRSEIMLADTPASFAQNCTDILRDDELSQTLTRNALDTFERNWTWDSIKPRIASAIDVAFTTSHADTHSALAITP